MPEEQGQPPQTQDRQPGREHEMNPRPEFELPEYKGADKLKGKVALITGGDSGIGRAVAVLFAREGADVAIVYLEEDRDARKTRQKVEEEGRECLLIKADIRSEKVCIDAVQETLDQFGRLDILINNAAIHYPKDSITEITEEQLDSTFRTNVYASFFFVKAALPHLPRGGSIIQTTSITAYRGSGGLLDYASTKGALVSMSRSLAMNEEILDRGIRVNTVAPGPIWTPLIPASFDEDHVADFGKDAPMGRAGQPEELAPAFVFLASNDSSYITGQTIHVNGGTIIGG